MWDGVRGMLGINRPTCVNGGKSGTDGKCHCPKYFEGSSCERKVCLNGGSLKKVTAGQVSFECVCPHPLYIEGVHCETIRCANQAPVIRDANNSWSCDCSQRLFHKGVFCEKFSPPIGIAIPVVIALIFLLQIMHQLVVCLREPRLQRDAKVMIIGNFGDIALAIGEKFSRYAEHVMGILKEASGAVATDPNDYDQVDYVDKLRENVINSYVDIVQSMCPENYDKDQALKERAQSNVLRYAESMIELIIKCCDPQPEPSDALVGNIAGLIGDLLALYGPKIVQYLNNEKVGGLLSRGRRSKTAKTKSISNWAFKEMRKVAAH